MDFLRRSHAVYRGTPTSPLTNTELLSFWKSLATDKQKQLVANFTDHESIITDLYQGETIESETGYLKHGYTKAVMFQLALGNENVCTHSIRFSDEFMDRISKHSSQSISQVVNKTIKKSLKETWSESPLADGVPMPLYVHVLDYPEYVKRDTGKKVDPLERGPGGFHVHGLIQADDVQLHLAKQAFIEASNGYKSGHTMFGRVNKAVHFGEPCGKYENRGGKSTNCLSDYPGAVRASYDDYNFNQCWYMHNKEKPVRAAEKALKVNVGSMWGSSAGLRAEADASLRLFKALMSGMQGVVLG
ncbi:hypothetical protein A3709_16750 [Halioglobus sp. HI00S01]|nr:hypothetical protein A3709_16750 [Halioglobus sp. HI00S01]